MKMLITDGKQEAMARIEPMHNACFRVSLSKQQAKRLNVNSLHSVCAAIKLQKFCIDADNRVYFLSEQI